MRKWSYESPEREKARADPHHVGISGLIWSRKLGCWAPWRRLRDRGRFFRCDYAARNPEAELHPTALSFNRQAKFSKGESTHLEIRQTAEKGPSY